jgi:hypothetical protein
MNIKAKDMKDVLDSIPVTTIKKTARKWTKKNPPKKVRGKTYILLSDIDGDSLRFYGVFNTKLEVINEVRSFVERDATGVEEEFCPPEVYDPALAAKLNALPREVRSITPSMEYVASRTHCDRGDPGKGKFYWIMIRDTRDGWIADTYHAYLVF